MQRTRHNHVIFKWTKYAVWCARNEILFQELQHHTKKNVNKTGLPNEYLRSCRFCFCLVLCWSTSLTIFNRIGPMRQVLIERKCQTINSIEITFKRHFPFMYFRAQMSHKYKERERVTATTVHFINWLKTGFYFQNSCSFSDASVRLATINKIRKTSDRRSCNTMHIWMQHACICALCKRLLMVIARTAHSYFLSSFFIMLKHVA